MSSSYFTHLLPLSVVGGSSYRVSLDEPFAVVDSVSYYFFGSDPEPLTAIPSPNLRPYLAAASPIGVSPDGFLPYGIVAGGFAGLSTHPALLVAGSTVVVSSIKGTLCALIVATHSSIPPNYTIDEY